MSMTNIAIKNICRIKDVEFQERIIIRTDYCPCKGKRIMMWPGHDQAVCLRCEREFPVKQLERYFEGEHSFEKREYEELMKKYK